MFKSLFTAATFISAISAASLAAADNRVDLDVSYIGGVASEADVEGESYDTDLRMQGIKGAFSVPMGDYAFWTGSYDYSSDDIEGLKTEITLGKLYAGGRLPVGEQFAVKAYVGYATNEITEDGSSGSDSGAMFGLAAEANLIEALALEAHFEQANLGDVTFQEAGVNGYWYFTPVIAAGLGYKYRDYEVDEAGLSFGLDFSYIEAGLRISF